MDKLVTRRAEKNDAKIIADLIYETENYPEYEWGKGTKEEHLERLVYLIKQEDNRFSYNNIICLTNGNNVIGISLYLKGNELKTQTFKADILLMPMQKGIVRKLMLVGLAIYYLFDRECSRDELYLSNIIIKKEYRGRGLSNILMGEIEKITLDNKLDKISLRANNEALIQFYKGIGFKLVNEDKLIKNV
ncbi:MAG: GNAT family N-acetyltransferase [Clostridium sp.]